MNPLTNVRNITKLNEQELRFGIFEKEKSWHNQYKDSAYIFIGGLPYELTEGDILCVFSQYGEIININLVRDKKSGKSKGYGFLAYEDQRSTILAVDNFNGIKLGGRTIRVDHVDEYRRPKGDEKDETGKFKELDEQGCAPKTPSASEEESEDERKAKKAKKSKKEKKSKKSKKEKKKDKRNADESRSETRKSREEEHLADKVSHSESGRREGRDQHREGYVKERLERRPSREKNLDGRQKDRPSLDREKERRREEAKSYLRQRDNPDRHLDRKRHGRKERSRSRSPYRR